MDIRNTIKGEIYGVLIGVHMHERESQNIMIHYLFTIVTAVS